MKCWPLKEASGGQWKVPGEFLAGEQLLQQISEMVEREKVESVDEQSLVGF